MKEAIKVILNIKSVHLTYSGFFYVCVLGQAGALAT